MADPGPCILSKANIHPVCSFQQIQLWWQAPTTGGTFDYFVISLGSTPVLTLNKTINNTVITGLTNATEYQYSIRARNSATNKLGPNVSWRSVQPGNRTVAPTFISFIQTIGATTTLNVSWAAPTLDANTGAVKWYIFTAISSSGISIRYPLLPSDRSISLTGLNSAVTYTGELVAINDTGYSPPVKNFMALLGGESGQGLAWTMDGINWNSSASSISLVGNCDYECSAYNGSSWLAGISRRPSPTTTNRIIGSSDGINWTSRFGNTYGNTSKISWNGTRWIALVQGATKEIIYSSDGISWASVSVNPTTNPRGLYSSISRNLSVVCGSGATPISYSTDGITWIAAISWPSFSQGQRVFYNGTRWVIGTSGVIGTDGPSILIYSNDAGIWTASANGNTIFTAGYISGLASNGSIWVAGATLGTNRLGWSDDGITWNASTNGNNFFTRINGITWTGTYFLAAGTGVSVGANTCAYSADGKTWTASAINPITTTANCVDSSFLGF